jgi:hypothetical protein
MFSEFGHWAAIRNLDILSQIYFGGTVCGLLYAMYLFSKLLLALKKTEGIASYFIRRRYLQIATIQSLAIVLTSGCVGSQIFSVWFTYMLRFTDANPFAALRQAWMVFQLLIFFHILLEATRRCAWLVYANREESLSPRSQIGV